MQADSSGSLSMCQIQRTKTMGNYATMNQTKQIYLRL